MVQVPKPPSDFMQPFDVQDGDVVSVAGNIEVISAEESRFGRQQLIVPIKLASGEQKRWRINRTTHRALYKAWGDNDQDWIGQRIRVNKAKAVIRGEQREVLYGEPYADPQQTLPPRTEGLKEQLKNLTPQEREALLKNL